MFLENWGLINNRVNPDLFPVVAPAEKKKEHKFNTNNISNNAQNTNRDASNPLPSCEDVAKSSGNNLHLHPNMFLNDP